MDICLWELFVANLVGMDPFVLIALSVLELEKYNRHRPGLSLTNSRRARLDTVARFPFKRITERSI